MPCFTVRVLSGTISTYEVAGRDEADAKQRALDWQACHIDPERVENLHQRIESCVPSEVRYPAPAVGP